MSAPTPTAIHRLADDRIQIDWSDGVQHVFTARGLREACPCATCREKRSAPPPNPMQLTVLSSAEARPLTIAGMRPVGAYAYNIAFSDGHDSGLFTMERLRELGAAIAAS
ncbi:hypothetical protein Pla108_00060 [Botrimarina colliarenosi]|uniref:Gamma-butyrobetaine hydroxylase-like N-terminal domain-containing protein n=1 Tax=Botrimarina colliarenosi TaxID=2528001 RepID=A0A5C6ALM3_9BACT|nr:DUF971 domain-containing protein [Botrimarina colliarenosi]TWT99073.1 hypothetical protein Pla108_00060 [Botrimarina colliarenosi]